MFVKRVKRQINLEPKHEKEHYMISFREAGSEHIKQYQSGHKIMVQRDVSFERGWFILGFGKEYDETLY